VITVSFHKSGQNDFVASTKRFVEPHQILIVTVKKSLVTATTVIVVVSIHLFVVTMKIVTTTILFC